MEFTQKEALQRGKDRKAGKGMSAKQARVFGARNIMEAMDRLGIDREKFGVPAYYALCQTIIAGEWDEPEIMKMMAGELEDEGICIHEVKQILVAADILIFLPIAKCPEWPTGWRPELRRTFKEKAHDMVELGIEEAPARLEPLKSVPNWVQGETNLNHNFIARTSKRIIDSIPQAVLTAANDLQDVGYRVNEHLAPALQLRWNELDAKKATRTGYIHKLEMTQLATQINLLKQLIKQGHEIHFMITADYRGRFYYRGGLITPQGHDFCKAAFQYNKSVKLGKHGMEHIARHYANVFGIKGSIEDRIAWAFKEGAELAIAVGKDGYFPTDADKPYQTLVAAHDWYALMQHVKAGKKPKSYKSRLVCHVDGSCNGLQHGAVEAGCNHTAQFVNCLPATKQDKPEDAYYEASDVAAQYAREGRLPDMATMLNRYGRRAFKQAVMITTYGSNAQVAAVLNELTPKEALDIRSNQYPMAVFESAVDAGIGYVADPLLKLNAILQTEVEAKMKENAQAIFWKTSDGFPVMQNKRKPGQLGGGLITYTSKDVDPKGQKGAITANFIHSMDGDHMRETVRRADFSMTTVHDSFGCHAGNMEALHRILRESFVYVHRFDYIGALNKYSKMTVEVPPKGDYCPEDVLKATYFFS